MALKGTDKAILEAARAASLASHSAAGLATAAGRRDVGRLLRSAEALCRAAVAALLATSASGSPLGAGTEGLEKACAAKEKTKRRPNRKQKMQNQLEEDAQDALMGQAATMGALVANLQPGGSMLVGDLSEFGVLG